MRSRKTPSEKPLLRSEDEIKADLSFLKQYERELIQELKDLSIAPESEKLDTWHTEKQDSFSVGERVYIVNEITPFNIIPSSKDRKATVRRVSDKKYYITTDNNFNTYRLGKFLRRLVEKPKQK